jgi:hypothetical protein
MLLIIKVEGGRWAKKDENRKLNLELGNVNFLIVKHKIS